MKKPGAVRAVLQRRVKIDRRAGQRGFSLLTTLMFMIAALVLGISVMGVNVMQERIIGNSRDTDLALQSAEATLRDAEADIRANISPTSLFTDTCTDGLCTPPSMRSMPSSEPAGPFTWAVPFARQYGAFTAQPALPVVSAQPLYIIEKLGSMGAPPGESVVLGAEASVTGVAYRITARAVGARPETVVTLQSIYATR